MVRVCSVKSCKNSSRKNQTLKFHKFPTKQSKICNSWIARCGLADNTDSSKLVNKHVCSSHFRSSDYTVDKNFLMQEACPSINVIGETINPNHLLVIHTKGHLNNYIVKLTDSLVLKIEIKIDEERANGVYNYNVSEINSIAVQPIDQIASRNRQSIRNSNKRLRVQLKQSRKIKSQTFKQKLRWKTLYKKIIINNRVSINKEKQQSSEKLTTLEHKYAMQLGKLKNGLSKLFTEKQIDVLVNNKQKTQWTNAEIARGISIKYKSNTYDYLRSLGFPLPSTRCLQQWTRKISFPPGILFPVINLLQQEFANAPELSKICVLAFDEMSIDSSIAYDPTEDRIYGPKANMNCFFVRGLFSKWKQLVAYDFDDGFQVDKYLDLITILEHSGLKVVANVNDLGGKNRGLMSKLGVRVQKIREENAFYYDVHSSIKNPVSGRNIYFFADVPHLIKLLRNNLLTHGLTIKGGFKIEKKDYDKLLSLDLGELKANWKLTKHHLNVKGREKQRVRPAVEMFSRTVAAAWRIAFPNRLAEATFIELVNDYFDIMNSRIPEEKLTMKQPFGFNAVAQLKVLDQMEDAIINLTVGSSKALYPFQRGFLLCIYSMRGLYKEYIVESSLGVSYILTHHLLQDFVENAFSMIRTMGSYNDNPTPVDAKRRLKLLMLAWSFIGSRSVPVEFEDSEGYLSSSMIQCLTDSQTSINLIPISIPLSDNIPEVNEFTQDNFDDVMTSMGLVQRFEESGKEYVSGFVASKFKNIYPELVATPEEINIIGHYSWVKSLSQGGLTIPALKWRNMCETLYSEFYDFHRSCFNNLNRCTGVFKSFTESLSMKYPNIPKLPLKKYIFTIMSIRIKNENKKLCEERIQKRQIIADRTAARQRRAENRFQMQNDMSDSESELDGENLETNSCVDFNVYNPNVAISSYDSYLANEDVI